MSATVYEIITERILEELNKGEVPWHRPWTGGGYPKNLVSKKEYRGINVFLLSCQKFSSPYWVSYKQAQELGGNVKKGEKSTMVVFWKQVKVKDTENTDKEKTIPFLRYYRIFNVEQCENIDQKKIPQIDSRPDFHPIAACEITVDGMPKKPEIKFEGARAYYHTAHDFVNMPKKESFDSEEFYYSVLFHELGHATGHKERLDRTTVTEATYFGSENYSKEELVAEMTASFLCGHCQIENKTIDNSVAYIKSWLKKLQDDAKMVVLAAAAAQRAADFILAKTY